MKELPSLDLLNREFFYDPLSGEFFRRADGYSGYINDEGYRQIAITGEIYSVHRIVWKMHSEADPKGKYIDHINGDRRDNRIANLRLASITQNNQNRGMSSHNTTGIKNVCWESSRSRWRVCVRSEGVDKIERHKCLGRAAKAAHIFRKAMHAEFARSQSC